MIYGLYLSAQGADAAAFHQAVIANNLANSSSPGFKPDVPVFQAHAVFDQLHLQPQAAPDTIDDQTGGLTVAGTVTDFSPGSLTTTGSDLDVAVIGQRPAFLEVGVGQQRFLTRNGQMTVNENNQLVTADTEALPVLGVDGDPIEVPLNVVRISIASDGSVAGVLPDNTRQNLGQLSLVEPESLELLEKHGTGRYLNWGKSLPALDAQVRQGVFEQSASEPISGMVNMIQSSRGFEMNMNLIRLQDETVARLLQSIPRK